MIMIYSTYSPLLHLTSNGHTFKPSKCLETKSEDEWKIEVECSKSYKDYIAQHYIIVAPTKEKGMQPFRIGNITLIDDVYSFTARHVFYDTKGYMLQDVYPQDQNGTQVMAWLFGHSTPLASLYSTSSDIAAVNTARYVRKSLYDSLLEARSTWGGHLDPDNYTVALRASIGVDRQVTIADAKNLEGIEIYENWDNVVTTIIPTCGERIYDPIVSDVSYPTPYVRAISFESSFETDAEIQADVIAQAIAYMEKNKYPLANYKVKSDVLQNVAVGDLIRVKSIVLLNMNVILYTHDILTKTVKSVEFGNYQVSAKSVFSSYAKVADVAINQAEVNQIMIDQTNLLNNLYKFGYCVRTENETYYVDALPKEDATSVRRDNIAGIGFSSSGINGPFTTAWTLDGKFNADFIKTGTLDVARINGSAIDISANASITSKVSASYVDGEISDVNTNINNIQVGGRNYLLNSAFTVDLSGWAAWQTAVISYNESENLNINYPSIANQYSGVLQNTNKLSVIIGDVYTISAYIKRDDASIQPSLQVGGAWEDVSDQSVVGVWCVVKATLIMAATATSPTVYFHSSNAGLTTGNLEVAWIKVEKGNKATDWTLAPEDTDALIDAAQASADDANNSIGSLVTRVNTAEEKITPEAITSTVTSSTTYTTDLGGKEAAIYKQTAAPETVTDRLWLDTSVTPNVLKIWNGSAWVKATPTVAGEVDAYSKDEVDTTLTSYGTLAVTSTAITLAVGTKEDAFYKQATEPFEQLITNGDFSDGITGWATQAGINTSSTDRCISSPNSLKNVATGSGSFVQTSVLLVIGHIYYVSWNYYISSFISGSIFIQFSNGADVVSSPIVGAWTKRSLVFTGAYSGANGNAYCGMLSGTATSYIDNFIVIDLTAAFGAGNEPTLAQMDGYIKKLWLDTLTNTYKSFDGGGWKPSSLLKGAKYVFDGEKAKYYSDGQEWYDNSTPPVLKVYFDTVNSKYVFNGEVVATSGSIGRLSIIDDDIYYQSDLFAKQYDNSDVTRLRQVLAGIITGTSYDSYVYDINSSGALSATDIIQMREVIAGTRANPNKMIRSIIAIGKATGEITVTAVSTGGYVGPSFTMQGDRIVGKMAYIESMGIQQLTLNGLEVYSDAGTLKVR